MPIATDPYFYGRRSNKTISPSRKGSYYYPARMTYYTYDRLMRETRNANYRLPCHCPVCDSYETIIKADELFGFNSFRRVHDILYKNIENKMFREVMVPFHQALGDLLARAKIAWAQFMPDNPEIDFQ